MAPKWDVTQMQSQAGKRFFITGGNSGIGYGAALELVRHGATVVLACRNRQRAEAAVEKLLGAAPSRDRIELVELNLAALHSVRKVAQAELSRGVGLDGLINNAGIMAPPRRLETEDGFELQFGVNVLAHFALTAALLPALERSAQSPSNPRAVTVASIAHKHGKIDFDDLQSLNRYSPRGAYAQSKLANLMFSLQLEQRLRATGKQTISIAVHPGVARTNLFKFGSSTGMANGLERLLQWAVGATMNSEAEGALPTLFAATAPEAMGGAYYGPQGFQEMRGGNVGEASIAPAARDQAAQKLLWQRCEELTGISFLS